MKKFKIFDSYQAELEEIKGKFLEVYLIRKVNKKLTYIIESNPRTQQPHVFWWWVKRNYIFSVVLETVKLVDRDKRNISLLAFLEKIKQEKSLNVDNFLYNFKKSNNYEIFSDEDVKKWFYNTVKKSGADSFDSMIKQDIINLKNETQNLKKIRDTVVAHNSRKNLKQVFNVKEVDEKVDFIRELLEKYSFLINPGNNLFLKDEDILDSNFNNFEDLFKIAWINSEPTS